MRSRAARVLHLVVARRIEPHRDCRNLWANPCGHTRHRRAVETAAQERADAGGVAHRPLNRLAQLFMQVRGCSGEWLRLALVELGAPVARHLRLIASPVQHVSAIELLHARKETAGPRYAVEVHVLIKALRRHAARVDAALLQLCRLGREPEAGRVARPVDLADADLGRDDRSGTGTAVANDISRVPDRAGRCERPLFRHGRQDLRGPCRGVCHVPQHGDDRRAVGRSGHVRAVGASYVTIEVNQELGRHWFSGKTQSDE